jgi:UDP-N-acetylglucosamine/UDP-N-acetylgalactosamine diphosphorylase
MDYDALRSALHEAGQAHVAEQLAALEGRSRRRLARQLNEFDLSVLPELHAAIEAASHPKVRKLSPAPVYELADREFPYALHEGAEALAPMAVRALENGEVAVLLVAGGQGTRLGFDGPKGCYPLLPETRMTLFEVFARKLLRIGREYGQVPPLYVMVGEHNRAQTRNYFEDHDFFGLDPEAVLFFAQGAMPALDDDGKLVMEAPDRLFLAPDGHGGVIRALKRMGMLTDMAERGIRTVSYLQVDNVQAPVADPAFLGLHIAEGADMSLKVVRKTDPDEKVGIYCLDGGSPCIVEYTEFSSEQSTERDAAGDLRFWAGSIAVHAFSLEFLQVLAGGGATLPLHANRKPVPRADGEDAPAWKFERFVFDAIPLASRVACLEVPRDEQFLPLKNADGEFGPDGVRQSYANYWAAAVERAAGYRPGRIEVDPAAFENARELLLHPEQVPAAGEDGVCIIRAQD